MTDAAAWELDNASYQYARGPIAVGLVAGPGGGALRLSLGQQLEALFPPRRWQPAD